MREHSRLCYITVMSSFPTPIVIALTLSLISQGGPAQAPPVAPDRSLSPQAYVQKGMPASDREWFTKEYGQAASVLKSLAASDATQLPRYGSPVSGAVFARIVSRDSLKLAAETELVSVESRLLATAEIFWRLNQIVVVYAKATTTSQVFDSEVVELLSYILEVSCKMMLLGETVIGSRPADAADRAALLKDREQARQGVATVVRYCLEITEKKGCRVSELVRLAQGMEKTLPEIAPLLPPEAMQEFAVRLQRMLEQESDPTIKQALQHVAAALDKSNKTPRVVRK
jgi:hypothetical protein